MLTKNMLVQDLAKTKPTRGVKSLNPNVSIREFAKFLRQNNISAAVLRHRNNKDAGVATERDLADAVAKGLDLDRILVHDIMTPIEKVRTVSPRSTVEEMMADMVEYNHRHAFMRGTNGQIEEVFSMRDINKALVKEQELIAIQGQ